MVRIKIGAVSWCVETRSNVSNVLKDFGNGKFDCDLLLITLFIHKMRVVSLSSLEQTRFIQREVKLNVSFLDKYF